MACLSVHTFCLSMFCFGFYFIVFFCHSIWTELNFVTNQHDLYSYVATRMNSFHTFQLCSFHIVALVLCKASLLIDD